MPEAESPPPATPDPAPNSAPAGAPAEPAAPAEPPLRSVHTNTFAQILDRQGVSLAVTTYQAGKLVLLRSERGGEGPLVNTHFRGFQKPMGFAWERGRFALGTAAEIWEFHDIPAVAPKLDEKESKSHHDAAFLPRICHCTGDIQIHEMLWLPRSKAPGGSVWVVGALGDQHAVFLPGDAERYV